MDSRSVKTEGYPDDIIASIFNHQSELIERYRSIEGLPELPIDLDVPKNQKLLREFAWRVIEELGEADGYLKESLSLVDQDRIMDNEILFLEEIGDAIHFLIELYIFSGVTRDSLIWHCGAELDVLFRDNTLTLTPKGILDPSPKYLALALGRLKQLPYPVFGTVSFREAYLIEAGRFMCSLGEAMNILKNKPWKTTQMITDQRRYIELLLSTFNQFLRLLARMGLTAENVYDMYYKKFKVNKFRQESGY